MVSDIYKKLIKNGQPFFNLIHGSLYDCKVEHERGIENTSIIPLAFEEKKNRQFIMTDARKLYKQKPSFVHEIIKMDFSYIMNDGIRSDYPSEYEALTILCATQKDGTLVGYSDETYFDFKETNEI